MHTHATVRTSRLIARRPRLLLPVILAIAASIGAACTEPVPPATLASMRIVPQQDSFFNGTTTAANPFAVTLLDANSTEIRDGRTITYSSSNTAAFTVDSRSGAVTAVAVGSGLYRASASGRFIEASVKIIAPVDRVQLNTGDFTLTVGNTRQLVPTLTSPNGSAISGRALNYSSTNPAVASVGTGGLITAISEGTTTITVSVEGKSASVVVTVQREAVASVQLTPLVAQLLRIGGQLQVTAQPLNSAGQPLTGRTVAWSTNNPAVATVSPQGVVTAIGVGNATITAVAESRTASLGITVTEIPAKTVTLEPATFSLATNLTRQLAPTVIDSAGNLVTSFNNRQVIWQSSSSIVASVSSSGVVTGTGSGVASIYVTVDGVRSNDVVVTVSSQVASVVVTPFNPQVLRIGTTVQLTAQARDNANQPIAGKTANWTSNNPTIASVTQGGLVTGVATGTTTITAEIDNRTASVQVTVTLIPVGSVVFTPSTDTLIVGDQRQYNPIVKDTAGAVIPSLVGRSTTYIPSDNLILNASQVAAGVLVTGGTTPGTATVTALIDNVPSTPVLTIRVVQVNTMTLTPSSASVPVNTSVTLTLELRDAANNVLKLNKPIVNYNSSSSAIASVPSTGGLTVLVTGKSAGTVTITANVNGLQQTAVITVP